MDSADHTEPQRRGPPKGTKPKSAERTRQLNVRLAKEALGKATESLLACPVELEHRAYDLLGEAEHQAFLAVRHLREARGISPDGEDE